ncbi:leucine-zipper-like transcriptional regulator 1 homolog [Archocentrus centrarchus]|uniref:leucine-zipper-like transcriptional regulator 1 homolog n=1 Tax=Archocentrus centrarchus TaxID=63155 RepID=UPI0011E9CE32|nr:leucine-zipper-like transcriptional regulator 1 homolog [Archocentrus centrarchus]XP_030613950.1 leucine-zipper-like transcriptional regulator 1 homolog [Archocentrus centrarchus]XP_030613951.1 leucine-zipper-like transcriptional regulator 1 homolog [Archocentrus centrarchus]XP_030613952.1 leucine-zipper-like transcriptional regulator 1 homolog [Archocentrus centrarchus]
MSQRNPSLWTRLPPRSSRSPCDRYKHACCSHSGNVYVLGGRESSCLRDFWRYSVVLDEWTELNCTGEAAPEELEGHTMVAHEGFLYVFGGLLDSAYSACRCALWVFDIAKQKWVRRQEKSSLQKLTPTNRKSHSAVVLGSAMLMYGGFVDMKGTSPDFWSLDFDTMAWSLLSGSQQDSLGPGPRHSHSAAAYQGCMYLFGGLKGLREQRDFWKWSSSSHTWSSLRYGPPKLMGHSAVTYKDSMLIFGGGETQDCPKNCLWMYSFITQTWVQLTTLPGSSPPDKIHHCCTGLGLSYKPSSTSSSFCCDSGLRPRVMEGKLRPFKNKCVPVPRTFLESDGAIELKSFAPDKCLDRKGVRCCSEPQSSREAFMEMGAQKTGSCLTFENKAFRKTWSCSEEVLEDEDGDIARHLPDLLLVLGGKPCTKTSPISMWQVTLID